MLAYSLKRLLLSIPTIFVISVLSFVLIQLPPGDFLSSYAATLASMKWRSIGPVNMAGRMTDIAVDPRNPKVFYLSGAGGGIWKTVNAGTTFFSVWEKMPVGGIGDLAISPSNPNIIYAGTGEGYFNIDALRGIGVMKSTDGGASWTTLSSFSGSPAGFPYFINDLYIRPDNTSIIYAATNTGVYRTTNAGTSWTMRKMRTRTRREGKRRM